MVLSGETMTPELSEMDRMMKFNEQSRHLKRWLML
jgi:hypothetical protein